MEGLTSEVKKSTATNVRLFSRHESTHKHWACKNEHMKLGLNKTSGWAFLTKQQCGGGNGVTHIFMVPYCTHTSESIKRVELESEIR